MDLKINNETCISCGRCVTVCPTYIFSAKDETIEINNPEGCITCGHCVAACPTDSVFHSEFPASKVHSIDYSQMPTPEQVMLLCKMRRSNRAFTEEPVPAEMIAKILEAAHVAPTASNLQQVKITVVTDKEKLEWIRRYTIDTFSGIVNKLENPILKPILKLIVPSAYKYIPTFKRMMNAEDKTMDLILRHATAVLFIHTPTGNRFGCQDANLAYQNGSLMAEALGVSQFYTGFVCSAIKQDKSEKLAKEFGIEGTIHAGMAFGMPSFRFPKYIDRKALNE